jgi:Fic family protein
MDNWEKYLHFEEKDRLVQLAIVKAQFELIHPFLDGNGRIGRMLVPLFLYEKKMLSSPMFYLSEYLEEHRDTYYEALLKLSSNDDWDGWIAFFLSAVIKQAESNSQKTNRILALYEFMKKQIPRTIHSQYVVQAIDTLFAHPIFSSTDFIVHSGIPKDSALRILKTLKKGEHILELKRGSGRRASVMTFPKLMAITENTTV